MLFIAKFYVSMSKTNKLISDRCLFQTNFSFVPIMEMKPELEYRFNITAVTDSGIVDVSMTTDWITLPKGKTNLFNKT